MKSEAFAEINTIGFSRATKWIRGEEVRNAMSIPYPSLACREEIERSLLVHEKGDFPSQEI